MKLDPLTIVQVGSFSSGVILGLVSKYSHVNFIPIQVQNFFFKHFCQSGRHLIQQDKRQDKRFSYNKSYSIHRGVSNERAPTQ